MSARRRTLLAGAAALPVLVAATAAESAHGADAVLVDLAAAHRASEAAFSAAVEAAPCDKHPGAAEAVETARLVEAMTATPAAGALGIAAKAGVICASLRENCGGISFAEEALAGSLADDLVRLMPAAVGA